MLAKQIGTNIKTARKARGWSLERLAARVEPETSYQQLARLADGRPHRPLGDQRAARDAQSCGPRVEARAGRLVGRNISRSGRDGEACIGH